MNCLYCRAWNSDDEHRCHRCGRRLNYTTPPTGTATPYSHSALAEEPATRPHLQSQPRAARRSPEFVAGSGAARRPAPSYQRTLFGTKELGQVLPFEAFMSGVNDKPRAARSGRPRVRRQTTANQQSLDFAPAMIAPAIARPSREGVIYCDARVASLEHRSLAAFIDGTVVALALGAFVAVLYSFGGEVVLNKYSAPIYAAVAAITISLYRLLWCLGNGDSPGMRIMQLRLVDLDGRRPDRRKRFLRLFSGWLSVLAAGLGLFWALADEESLTWHDHISETFPTLRE